MSLFGKLFSPRPLSPIRKPSVRPGQVQKPVLNKPVVRPDFFQGGGVPIKKMKWQMIQEAKMGKLTIPGTGGQKMTTKQVEDIFKQRFSYGKVKTHLDNRSEAIRILRQIRTEDKGKPSRERRVFEERWNLKSGRDY